MSEHLAILRLAQTADAAETGRLLALNHCSRIDWAREQLPALTSDDEALDEMLCIFLRAGTREKKPAKDGAPAVQCKVCGVSIVTRWDLKTRKFVEPPHGCMAPWRFGVNLQHHGKGPEPSLADSVADIMRTAWAFSDYSPGKPDMTRKVVRVLNARTQALEALLALVEKLHPDADEVRHARLAVELE